MATFIYPQIDISDLAIAHIETNTANTVTELQDANSTLTDLDSKISTADKQDVGNASLASIDGKVSTAANQLLANATLSSIDGKVSTAAKQDTGNASLSSIDGKVATSAKQDTGNASLSSIDSKVSTAANQTTANASLSSIDSKLSNGTQKTQLVDALSNIITSTNAGGGKIGLDVNVLGGGGGGSTSLTGIVDANNSSNTPLAANATFTGTATDIKDYGTVSVLVASDVASATGGFSFQFSNNGTNWDHAHNFDFAGGNLSYNISAEARYFRIVYTNNSTPQSYFRLQTVLRPVNVAPSQYTVSQTLTDYSLSTVTKGVIYGKTTGMGGGYVAVKVNPSGALTTENTVTSSVLPIGAATSANQTTANSSLSNIDTNTSNTVLQLQAANTSLSSISTYTSNISMNTATATNQTNGQQKTQLVGSTGTVATITASNALKVDGSAVTQPISATALPLPAGAATETTLGTRASESTLSTLNGKIPSNLTVSSTRLLVDGSGVTQPISAASLPLPTGAATETTLSALNQRLGGSLTPVKFDEIALTYVASGNGVGEIATAVFKLATVTVKTLTLSYDSSNRLTGVVAT